MEVLNYFAALLTGFLTGCMACYSLSKMTRSHARIERFAAFKRCYRMAAVRAGDFGPACYEYIAPIQRCHVCGYVARVIFEGERVCLHCGDDSPLYELPEAIQSCNLCHTSYSKTIPCKCGARECARCEARAVLTMNGNATCMSCGYSVPLTEEWITGCPANNGGRCTWACGAGHPTCKGMK